MGKKPFIPAGPVRPIDRRRFLLRTSAASVAAGAALPGLVRGGVHFGMDDTLKIGLVGCGGRGTEAVINACNADGGVRVTALADAFPDRIEQCLANLKSHPLAGARLQVTPETCFTGIQCHEGLIASGVDVVLLCQPPYFRPASLKAAVQAGKHVFCEKPVGVDVPGVLSVMDTCRNAGPLSIVSGLCWRYDFGVRETVNRIRDGAIGDLVTIQENYLTGELWHRGRKPEWSQIEYQMRNWLYFAWLSGDVTAEQHIHSLDKAVWLMGDTPPVRAYGMGGRQKRTGEQFGNIYDHFSTCYEWASGVRVYSMCRQMSGCFTNVEDHVFGTHGKARILAHEIESAEGKWNYDGPKPDMYNVEHQFLFRSIREGNPINNGEYMGISTLVALMGRDACYTGQNIEWADYLKDRKVLGPKTLDWGDYDPGPVPVPGHQPEPEDSE